MRKGQVGGTAGPLTLDAGALVAFERNDRSVRERIRAALRDGRRVTVPAGVLAQVWRDRSRTSDVIDASVVVCAREQTHGTVLTSDPHDLRHLDPTLDVQRV